MARWALPSSVIVLGAFASCGGWPVSAPSAPEPTPATTPTSSAPRWLAPPRASARAEPGAPAAEAAPAASVAPGHQLALGSAAAPFASYLNVIHQRIHPLFADGFLVSLQTLPPEHALSQPTLQTVIEIVLEGDDGRVVKAGIVRPSGVTAFDLGALDAVMRAAPFGAAPQPIRSADGRVYVHWELHRDPVVSCSAVNARPFLVRTP